MELRGGWAQRTVQIGQHSFHLLLPANPDLLLDHLLATQDSATEEPEIYWADLWPTASWMAQQVLEHAWPQRARALELGCGIGLVGLAGAAAGLQMTFSDLVPQAVQLALQNAHRHHLPAQGMVLDWHAPPLGQFPVLLGSDLLYDRRLHAPLLQTIDSLLSPDGQCWIGDPGRDSAQDFVAHARQRNFQVEQKSGEASGRFRLLILRRTPQRPPLC